MPGKGALTQQISREAYQEPDVETLRARLAEATEALEAIRQGDVDALIVAAGDRDQVYTLHTIDEPYRDLVEQMQEGAVVVAASGDILYCNARFAALVGAPLESVTGTPFDRFVAPSERAGFQALVSARNGRHQCQLIGADGATAFEVHLSLATTVSQGVDRLNLIVTDLRELHEAYSNRDRAKRESRMKDEFLAMLAHELRNPIGAINNAVQVLEATCGGGGPEAHARDVITRQVGHLSRLIDDLLDVERVVSGKLQLNRRPLDMAEAVRRAVRSVTGGTGLDRIDVSTGPVWIDGDAVRIEQVLTNIVTNAIKYTPPDGCIRVVLRGDGDDVLLTVEDTGVGIPPELLPRIFDMFIQGDRTLDRSRGGLGIGLTLVRRLVELHGGTITASSDGDGHGSRFTVRLPQIAATCAPAPAVTPVDRAEPRRVLLIEDNRDAREMLRMLLELDGHVVFDAAEGRRGLELLDTEHLDVAIIDIGLPGLDGYQVARRIREHPNGRDMLLLALTGYGFPSDRQHSTEAGFDHHLVKPVDTDALTQLLSVGALRVAATQA